MDTIISKKNKQPCVSLLRQTNWVNEQFAQKAWVQNRNIARKIVTSLSDGELSTLSVETRHELLQSLKAGRITLSDSKAIKRLLSSELTRKEYQERIIIQGSNGFINTTIAHLSSLSRLQIGRKLFKSLFDSGKQVTIIATDRISEAPPDNFKDAIPKGRQLKWQDLWGKQVTIKGTGKGSNTTVKYNPIFTYSSHISAWKECPPEIALAHELIHADDAAHGRLDPGEVSGVRNYERQAVGLVPYQDKEFTENKFRAAWFPPVSLRKRY
ncbi:MAG: hypothetical protein JST85_29195 [Acidobacteria bacterium]|nr:hypothetical protein [Acidobacteriota bacterium]